MPSEDSTVLEMAAVHNPLLTRLELLRLCLYLKSSLVLGVQPLLSGLGGLMILAKTGINLASLRLCGKP